MVEQEGQRGAASEERGSAVLLADAAIHDPATLHRHEQHDHAENIAEHGGGGVWLLVMLSRRQRGWTTRCEYTGLYRANTPLSRPDFCLPPPSPPA